MILQNLEVTMIFCKNAELIKPNDIRSLLEVKDDRSIEFCQGHGLFDTVFTDFFSVEMGDSNSHCFSKELDFQLSQVTQWIEQKTTLLEALAEEFEISLFVETTHRSRRTVLVLPPALLMACGKADISIEFSIESD